MNSDCMTFNEFTLQEASELLTEVRQATESCDQTSLYDFAGVLKDLISLRQNQAGMEDSVEIAKLDEFISPGLDAVRAAMESHTPDFERIEFLSDRAIDAWGEQLVAIREGHDEASSGLTWEGSATSPSELSQQESGEPDAPSAEAIQALLNQLGPGSPAQPASQPTVEADQDGTATTDETTPATDHKTADASSITHVNSLDDELREAFMDDAVSCLGSMESSLLRLESNPRDGNSLNQILRELHTLKGASASVGLSALADQIHRLEDGLGDDQLAGRPPAIDNLFKNVDQIRSEITGTSATPPASIAESAGHSTAQISSEATVSPAFTDDSTDDELVRVKSTQLNRLMDMLAELVLLRNQRETELAELQEVYHELITSVSRMRLLSNESDLSADSCKSLQLSEVASDVLETAQQLRHCSRPFAEGNAAVSRFIRQFRQELVELRRTPISGLFRRLQRVVRDAARAESKQVRLEMVGEDAGIERSLQQRLYEPLLHIVRNSVCHGIEPSEERTQNNKAPEGVVSLEARSGPDLFVIEVRDDGRGLDYEAIRRRGVERGLLANQVASREELSQLIFHPGFSTRESANQVGGRGVGMDVVAATMERLRGWLEIESEPGSGTRIRLSFPLPSVIQHAMVFRSANQLFALPMESVQAAGEVNPDIPQTSFCHLLGIEATQGKPSHGIVVADGRQTTKASKTSPIALLVDEILGPEELVVRPLPVLLKNHPFCVGASLAGMGQTVILLDPRSVLQLRTAPVSKASITQQPEIERGGSPLPSQRSRVLVVDDSVSARKRVVRSLSRYAVDIVEATDGKQALELLNQEKFAAVFSDMEMPNVDGMELLAAVNSPDRGDPPPVVIISSRSEKEFTDRARKLGASDYLIKPLTDEALDAVLRSVVPLRHLLPDTTASR